MAGFNSEDGWASSPENKYCFNVEDLLIKRDAADIASDHDDSDTFSPVNKYLTELTSCVAPDMAMWPMVIIPATAPLPVSYAIDSIPSSWLVS